MHRPPCPHNLILNLYLKQTKNHTFTPTHGLVTQVLLVLQILKIDRRTEDNYHLYSKNITKRQGTRPTRSTRFNVAQLVIPNRQGTPNSG